MKKRIGLLIFAKKGASRAKLVAAAKAHNLRILKPQFHELTFDAGTNTSITWRNRDLATWGNICLIRGTTKHQVEAKVVAEYLHQKGVTVIDKVLYSKQFLSSKLADDFLLTQAGIHHPETEQALDRKSIKLLLPKLTYPILVKDIHGAHSEGIYALKSAARAAKFFKWHDPQHFIIQKYLPTDYYIRVMIIGDQIIGAMKRTKLHAFADRSTNQTAKSEPYELTDEEQKIALKAHRAVGNDISGVDMLKVNGQLYVLEVNRAPQFSAMEEVCQLNIADAIIKFALAEHRSQKQTAKK